jgi:hypothetical protein
MTARKEAAAIMTDHITSQPPAPDVAHLAAGAEAGQELEAGTASHPDAESLANTLSELLGRSVTAADVTSLAEAVMLIRVIRSRVLWRPPVSLADDYRPRWDLKPSASEAEVGLEADI